MSIIQFQEANCKNCYNCVRHCQVKSIAVKNEQAQILEEGCILCGHCFAVCNQNAKYVQSDVNKVRDFLRKGNKVYISMAPSHAKSFPGVTLGQLNTAAKQLGFTSVEETAIGAGWVSAEYRKLAKEGKMRNIITTACPTVVMLVEKYYPQLTDCLAPVVSPMVAHARIMREIYGDRIKIVFVGPCISKKKEAEDSGIINATLSFDELKALFAEKQIVPAELDPSGYEMKGTINRMYPVNGGILRTVLWDKSMKYQRLAVDGLDRCMQILDELSDEKMKGYFVEMSACDGVCLGGPLEQKHLSSYLSGQELVKANVRRSSTLPAPISEKVEVDLSTDYTKEKAYKEDIPDEETILKILASTGKADPKMQLNCGTCGYPTCRDKAIAVYQGKADANMCLPFMREKAESYSNFVLDNTPSAVFVFDEDLKILDYNLAAIKMFDLTDLDYHGMPMDMILDSDELVQAKDAENHTLERRVFFKHMNLTVEEKVIYIPDHNNFMLLIEDITEELKKQEHIKQMRENTLSTAQKIIDKQMRTAQEIASLLGETTGESKAVLTNLKKSIMADIESEIKEE